MATWEALREERFALFPPQADRPDFHSLIGLPHSFPAIKPARKAIFVDLSLFSAFSGH